MAEKFSEFGLALSGGGARGIFHAGFIQALSNAHLQPAALSGTSMGAIVAGFYAAGVQPSEMLKAIKVPNIMHLRSWIGMKGGVGSLDVLREQLEKHIRHSDFQNLQIPLTVSVTNLNTGKNELISSGNLIEAIIASASIPIVFMPVKMGTQYFVDGGLTLNLPAKCLQKEGRLVIGVNCNALLEDEETYDTFRNVVERCLHIGVQNTVHDQVAYCDLYVKSDQMKKYHTFEFEKAQEIFNIGLRAGEKTIPKIEALLENSSPA